MSEAAPGPKELGAAPDVPADRGEMAALVGAKDWSKTPLGPVEGWSPALRMMVSFLLANRFPLLLWWGPDYISIYNDAYRPVLGAKHPWALGQPVRECWAEIADVLVPLIDAPFNGGPATWMDDILLEINRHGFSEETHFTIAYSPVPDDAAPRGIGGVLATVHEITDKIVGERRLSVLRDLGADAARARTAEDACSIAACALAHHAKDIPFALLYLIDQTGKRARLAGAAGVGFGETAAPIAIDLDSGPDAAWPLAEALRSEQATTVENIGARFPRVPSGPWSDPPHTAVVVPIKSNVAHRLAGFMVAGVSSRLRLDEQYRSFFDLAAAQIATAIATGRAYEEERKRAEALAEIDRAKTAFFSNVSHEFRTPLTLMLGPLEDALRRRDIGGQELEDLTVVHRNSLRLLKLVNSLLDFSRVEAGRMQVAYRATDLSVLTADLASSFRSACERAGLRLKIDCSKLPQPVYVDHDMWEKIVLNLLSNAFKFTFDGEISVSLRDRGDAVELTIRDSGTGIPEQEMPRLFERFHRIEGAHGRTHEGTGIGLALVQELVKLHGGSVRAESTLGEGSAFTIRLPFGIEHLPVDRVGAERTQASTATRTEAYVEEALRWLDTKGRPEVENEIDTAILSPTAADAQRPYVLLADDNSDMRDYVRRLLSPRYEVEAVADGHAALAAAKVRRPELILSDVMMPRLDGFELLRAIRSDEALKDVAVVLLSARAGEEARIEGLNAGADDNLTKPFSAREVVARVNANLELSRVRRKAMQTLRDSEARFRDMADNAPVMVWTTDASGTCTFLSRSWYEFTGQTPESGLGFGWLSAVHPDDRAESERIFRVASDAHQPFQLEYRLRRADGAFRWAIDAAAPWLGAQGEFLGYIGSVIDITERKNAEDQKNLLLGEMSHRIKNLFAVTGGLVMLSARHARTSAELAKAVNDRLTALSQAHELTRPGLTGRGEGANQNTTLHRLISSILAPYIGDRLDGHGSFVLTGSDLQLSERSITNLALVLHELATNAAKYGALSVPDGVVHVDGATDGGTLVLTWTESGGPTVEGEPHGEGFGGVLTRGIIRDQFGGELSKEWASDGLTVRMRVPIDRLDGAG